MSALARYSVLLLIAGYGIYQIFNSHAVAGLIGLGLAALIFWLGRKKR